MFKIYFERLYKRTMKEAYDLAADEIVKSLVSGGECLDCGAHRGNQFEQLSLETGLTKDRYYGIEWDRESAQIAQSKGLNIIDGDLNNALPFEDNKFTCIFGLSVLEHLLNPCHYLQECKRILTPGGKLVLLTPNISTYFTAALILAGKMPSSGPHPDSGFLVTSEEVLKVSSEKIKSDAGSDTPVHRHLIVFSYRVLKKYLNFLGFDPVAGYGFGLYPFPNFIQPVLEKIDPYHCHQMVFTAIRGSR